MPNRIFLFSFLFLFAIWLSGCDNEDGQAAQSSDYSYSASFSSLSEELNFTPNSTYLDGNIYVIADKTIDGAKKDGLFAIDANTNISEIEMNDNDSKYSCITTDSDGSIWLVQLDVIGDLDNEYTYESSLVKYDGESQQRYPIQLDDTADYITSLVIDQNENIIISTVDTVYVFDKNCNELFQCQTAPLTMFLSEGGTPCVIHIEDEEYKLSKIDVGNKTINQITELSNIINSVLSYDEADETLLYYDNNAVSRIDLSNNTTSTLFNWIDVDILGSSISSCIYVDDDSFLVLADEIANISKTESKPTDVTKQELVLGTYGDNEPLYSQIVSYNRSNSDIRLSVIDYSQYNTTDNDSQGYIRMEQDILAGNVLDIIDFSTISSEPYSSMGLLADLYPYLDSDSEISRDDIVDNVLELLEMDNHLYEATPGYTIMSFVGSASELGNLSGGSVADYTEALKRSNIEAFVADAESSLLLWLISNYTTNNFIDWSKLETNYESENFIQLLTFLEETMGTTGEQEAFLRHIALPDFLELQYYQQVYPDGVSFAGFPESGSSAYLNLLISLSIASDSDYKEEAWEFVRLFLIEENQINLLNSNMFFPSNSNSLKALSDYNMHQETTTDNQGNEIESSKGTTYGGDSEVTLYAANQEQIDTIYNLINSAEGIYRSNSNVTTILYEEGSKFFAGEITAVDAANLIDQRVLEYLNSINLNK